MKQGDKVEFRKAKDKNGQPDWEEWTVWEVNDTHVYICRNEEYDKWKTYGLGKVTINGKEFDELPYHVGLPKRDVRTVSTNDS